MDPAIQTSPVSVMGATPSPPRKKPSSVRIAVVTETRVSDAPGENAFAEYKFELSMINGTTVTDWKRWKECVAFSVDLHATRGISPLGISLKRSITQTLSRDSVLGAEFIEDRRNSLDEYLKRAAKEAPDAVLSFVRGELAVDESPSTSDALDDEREVETEPVGAPARGKASAYLEIVLLAVLAAAIAAAVAFTYAPIEKMTMQAIEHARAPVEFEPVASIPAHDVVALQTSSRGPINVGAITKVAGIGAGVAVPLLLADPRVRLAITTAVPAAAAVEASIASAAASIGPRAKSISKAAVKSVSVASGAVSGLATSAVGQVGGASMAAASVLSKHTAAAAVGFKEAAQVLAKSVVLK